MAMCKILKSGFYGVMSSIRLNSLPFFSSSKSLQEMAGKQYALMEKKSDEVALLIKGWRDVVMEFVDEGDVEKNPGKKSFKDYTGAMSGLVRELEKLGKGELEDMFYAKDSELFRNTFMQKAVGSKADWPGARKTKGILDELYADGSGKVDEAKALEFTELTWLLMRTYMEAGYDMNALFKTLNHGDFVENLLSVTQGGFKVAIAESIGKGLTPTEKYDIGEDYDTLVKDFSSHIASKFNEEGIIFTDKEITRLVNDMMAKSVNTGWLKKLNRAANEARGWYNILQLSPIAWLWGATSGMFFLIQSFLVGVPHYMARRISTDGLRNHELTQYLFKEEKFMYSEKVADVDMTVFEDAFNTTSFKAMNAVINNSFFNGAKQILPDSWRKSVSDWQGDLLTYAHGGVHNVFDRMMEVGAKQNAIAQSLGSIGITVNNADEFLAMLKAGKIKKEAVGALRTSSHKYFANFRTASDTLAMSRNVFSKLFFWNVRSGYLLNRAGDFVYGFERAAKAIADGEIKSVGDFMRHLDYNEDLRTVVINTLLSAKFATYADRYYDDNGTDGTKADRVVGYWNGLNDYYAALTSNLATRVLVGPINDVHQYVRFMNAQGQEVTVSRGVGAAAYGYLNEIIRATFKEFQVLDPLMEAGQAAMLGYDKEIVLRTFQTHWDRVSNSSARFSLMESDVPYGLRMFKQPDDYFNTLLMSVTDSNPSMKRYSDLRNVENLEKLFDNPTFALTSMLSNMNGLPKWFIGDFKEGQILDRIRDDMSSKDSILRNLYNGKWDARLVDSKNVDGFYKDLTSLSLPNMGLGEDGLKAASEYGLNIAKKEAFEVEMLKLIDKEDLMKKVTDAYAIGEDRTAGLIELMAYADAKVPGSSRLMLSYAASQAYTEMNRAYARDVLRNPKWQYENTDKAVPPDVALKNKEMIVNTFFPSMYVADKQSWYNAMYERMQQVHPDLLQFDNKTQRSFFSALGLMDLVAYGEAKSGNPDANFVKNVFAFTGKYVEDPALRMLLANKAMDSIDAVAPHPDVAAAAKLGFVAGNVEIIDKMLKDPTMVANHGKLLEEAMNKLFGNEKHINQIGSELVAKELSEADAKRYSQGSGNQYYPKKNASGNSNVKNGIESRVPGILSRLPSGYSPSNVTRMDSDPFAKYSAFQPKLGNETYSSWYATVYAQALGLAKTENIVSGYVNRFAGDTEKDDKFRLMAKAPKLPKQKAQWFDPKRARYAYKKNPFD